MNSDSKSLSLATISGEQWSLFRKFITCTIGKGDGEARYCILYDSKDSKSWIFDFFLAKGIAKTASSTNMEAKEIWMLSARGERIIARLRDISAEVLAPLVATTEDMNNMISSFGNDHCQSIAFLEKIYAMVIWRIIQDVAAFQIHSLQDKELHGMQRDFLDSFGTADVFHNIAKYFTFNFFIHIGRYLGYYTQPKRTSFAFAFDTYVLRCFCQLVYNNYADPSRFPNISVDPKTCTVLYGINDSFADDGFETVLLDHGDAANDDSSAAVEIFHSGWNSNSSEARVLKLFALKHWYEYCTRTSTFNKTVLMADSMTQAIDEYNRNCEVMKVAPIDTALMRQDAKRCAEVNWLDKLTSIAKDTVGDDIQKRLASSNSLEPQCPEGDPIRDWLPTSGHNHDMQARRSKWIEFYSYHLVKIKASSTINLKRKRSSIAVHSSDVNSHSSHAFIPGEKSVNKRFVTEPVVSDILSAKLPAVALTSAAATITSTSDAGSSQNLSALLTRENLKKIVDSLLSSQK